MAMYDDDDDSGPVVLDAHETAMMNLNRRIDAMTAAIARPPTAQAPPVQPAPPPPAPVIDPLTAAIKRRVAAYALDLSPDEVTDVVSRATPHARIDASGELAISNPMGMTRSGLSMLCHPHHRELEEISRRSDARVSEMVNPPVRRNDGETMDAWATRVHGAPLSGWI